MNTNNPDILFFARREYDVPSAELRAYKMEEVNEEFAFLKFEHLQLAVFSDDFQSVSLHHEYGKSNCLYNSAKNIPDLMKDVKKWQLSPIDRCNYERLRKAALGIYRQAGVIDFTTLEITLIKSVQGKNYRERYRSKRRTYHR